MTTAGGPIGRSVLVLDRELGGVGLRAPWFGLDFAGDEGLLKNTM